MASVTARAPRWVLGTAQLGMAYGIANTSGQPDLDEARRIIACALDAGIVHVDTAQAYGRSEAVLGEVVAALGVADRLHFATKLAATLDPMDGPAIAASLERSMARLKTKRLWCVLLHQPTWLAFWDGPLGETLTRYQRAGCVETLGVSLTTAGSHLDAVHHPAVEVLQAPCNAWDQRVLRAGLLTRARRLGKLCCVRSIYLQGLLTMAPEAVARSLPHARRASEVWHELARKQGSAPAELAMRFALSLDVPLVVGAESVPQVRDTLRMAALPPLTPEEVARIHEAMTPALSLEVLEPMRWPKQ